MNSLLSVLADPAATAVVQKFFPRGTLLQNGDLDRIREHLELVESCSQLTASNLFREQFVSLSFLGIEERLAELAPSWSFPPSLTLPRILHNFCMKKCVQIPAELLTLPLTILHDAYLQVWNAAGGYRAQGKPMAWLLTITRNLALSRLREHGRTEPLVQEDWQDHLADAPAVTHEDRMTLEALLSALGDQERQIVTLHALTGLKHREIAQVLGLPLATVLSKYSRALKKLQLAWKEAE